MIGKKILFLLLVGVLFTLPASSKSKVKVDLNALISKEADSLGIRSAVKSGDKFFKKGPTHYAKALPFYLKALEKFPDNPELNYLVGKCYLSTNNKKAALTYLLNSEVDIAPDYKLLEGRAYHMNLNFDKAISSYGAYRSSLSSKDWKKQKLIIDKYIRECDAGFRLVKDSAFAEILPLFVVNSEVDDYQPFMAQEDTMLFFTSRRSSGKKQNENFFYVPVNTIFRLNDTLQSVLSPGKKLNVKSHNSILSYNPSKNKYLLYDGKSGGGDLFEVEYKEDKWKTPKAIKGDINTKYKEGSGVYLDYRTLIFSSERADGMGGSDLYISTQDSKGKWKKPVNLGQMINTAYDEEVCGAGKDGKTLYFTSNGHNTMGGKDIFVSILTANGSWTVPQNMGYPINTPDDDFAFIPIDTTGGIICGYRPEGVGGLDILELKYLYPEIVVDDHFSVKLKITDRDDYKNLENVKVDIFNVMNDSLLAVVASDTAGFAYQSFPERIKIGFKYEKEGYESGLHIFDRDLSSDTLFFVPLTMAKKVIKIQDYSFSLMGQIRDEVSENFIRANIKLYDNTNDSLISSVITDTLKGRYSLQLDDYRKPYFVEILSTDYLPLKKIIVFKPDTTANVVYDFNLTPVPDEKSLTFIGRVLDETTQEPVNANMKFINPINQKESTVKPDPETGKYQFLLRDNHSMVVEISADGYFFKFEMLSPTSKDEKLLMHDFLLKPIKKGEKIVLNNILFETGRAVLTKSSYVELDKLVKIMKNSKINVEISGHTDNTGGYDLNKRLSQSRAEAVVKYLLLQGVEENRMKSAGYGPDQPIAPNTTKDGRAKNRRVEMKILD